MAESENTFSLVKQNEIIENSLVNNISSVFPVVGKYRTMKLNKFEVEPVDQNDFPTQKELKLAGKSWHTPMYGEVSVIDNVTGETLNKTKIKLANIPILTNRYSVIVNGNEYQTVNQFRLKPGVYTREKTNGEIESAFNLAKGFNFKMVMHPKEGIFYLSAGNQNYHLYTILHALGISDVEIRKAWGAELFQKNQQVGMGLEAKEIPLLYEKVRHKKFELDKAVEGLKAYFENDTQLDPTTTKITLGQSYDRVTPDLLMETSRKLLKVVRREEPDDERDSLVFKDLYTVSDLLHAHFEARKNLITQGIKYRLDTKINPREIISPETFNKPVLDFFYKGELSSTPTQTNPIDILSEYKKTTIMGPGGVGTEHAITPEMRDVHPSHIGFLDPTSTPESGAVGITLGLAVGAARTGERLLTFIRMKNGEIKKLSPYEVHNLKIGYPDQYIMDKDVVKAAPETHGKIKINYRGVPLIVPFNQVDGFFENTSDLFSFGTNLIPFLGYNSGNRVQIGSKMLSQAVPLKDPDAPLVQVKSPGENQTMERIMADYINPGLTRRYHTAGVVTKITPDYIHYKTDLGESKKLGLFNHFPLNQDSFITNTPTVNVGDRIEPGDIVAKNNFQKDGVLALGANLRVAYMPWKGQTFEDSVVITESAAKKLTSTHIMKEELLTSKIGIQDVDKYNAYFPGNLTKENMDKLDETGVIREGLTVLPDEYIAIYMEPRDLTDEEKILKSMYKALTVPYVDKSLKWEHNLPGHVQYVRRVGNTVSFVIEVDAPTEIGDKLVGRYGNKGIVSKIIADTDAPHTPDGERVDVLLSPFGYPGRTNTGQILETAASKIAKKTGKPYIVKNFDGIDYLEKIKKELKQHNLKSEEILLDGKNGKPFENPVLTGYQHILKLRHVIEKKFNARDWGSYTNDEQPVRGLGGGGAAMDILTTYAMLSHGAKSNLYDALAIKGQKNEEYWRNLRLGLPTPPPQSLFVWDKFRTYLQGAGVDVVKEGNYIKLIPLTDKDVLKLSAGKLKDAGQMLKGKNLAGRKGGLFDLDLTGGANGKKWTHIELDERFPNPLYEVAVRSILDLTKKGLEDIISGKKEITLGDKTFTGPEAITKMLKDVDVKQTLKYSKERIAKTGKTEVNKLNRKIRYLEALNTTGHTPAEVYTMKYVPVIPPLFRPIVPLPSGDLHVSPMNHHYHDIALLNNALKTEKDTVNDSDQIGKIRGDLYMALKAAQGHIDPVTFRKEKYEGLLATLAGNQPKFGLIQEKMWGKRQDLSGRTTITLEPDLGIDQVGLPVEMAKKLYKPFVIRELIRSGFKQTDSLRAVKDWTPAADRALDVVMKERPVLINRAPTLHRWGIQAVIPKLHDGKDLKMNPIVQGFNADYDGDTMSVHVPVSSDAIDEAWAMLPSRNMLHPSSNPFAPTGIHGLSKEFMIGVYHMTRDGDKTNKSFASLGAAKKAEKEGTLNVRDIIKIEGKSTTLGRALLGEVLPHGYDVNHTLDKNKLEKLFVDVAMKHPKHLAEVMDKIKDYGAHYGHRFPTSVNLSDLEGDPAMVKEIFAKYDHRITPNMSDAKKAEVWVDMTDEMFKRNAELYKNKPTTSNFKHILQSGAVSGGKAFGVHQITSAIGAVKDMYNKPLPIPIRGNYARGLDTFEYWQSMYGARKGAVDRAVNTQDSGELNKNLLSNTKNLLIVESDCDTTDFIEVDVDDKSLPGRFLAVDTPKIGKRNTLITPEVVTKLHKLGGIMRVKVRSPLTCDSVGGVCQFCYGVLPTGQPPALGTNVGVIDGQSLTERACNSSKSICLIRAAGKKELITLESLWNTYSHLGIVQSDRDKDTLLIELEQENIDIYDGVEFTKLRRIGRHAPSSEMVLVKTATNAFTVCQDNHPLPIYKSNFVCKYCNKWLYECRIQSNGKTKCYYCNKLTETPTSFIDNVWEKRTPKNINKRLEALKISLPKYDMEEQITAQPLTNYWTGFYLAEGSVSYGKTRKLTPRCTGISIKQKENYDWMNNLQKNHPQYSIKKGFSLCGTNYRINNKELGLKMEELYGRYSHNKHLPLNSFLFYDRVKILEILAGLIDGDGCLTQDSYGSAIFISTNSYLLVQQLYLLCKNFDWAFNLTTDHNNGLMTYQGWKCYLYFDQEDIDYLSTISFKIQNATGVKTKENCKTTTSDKDLITMVRPIKYNEEFVYDVETKSYLCWYGGIQSHNTQLTMQTFHTGSSAARGTASNAAASFKDLEEVFQMPEILPGKATLSTVSGRVNNIRKHPSGGYEIFVMDVPHYIPAGFELLVREGDVVSRGDKLCVGKAKPQELSELKDFKTAQLDLVNRIKGVYKDAFHSRTYESVIRGISDNAEVTSAPDNSGYYPGDHIQYSLAKKINKDRALEGQDPLRVKPYFRAINVLPMDKEDWLSQMSSGHIKQNLVEAAARMRKSNIHGVDPLPGMLYSAEFGQKMDPKKNEFY